ncbi:MAG: response regulator [Desulfovibrio sp.]|jgi:putative two-component system response regulator|nr:response regulator [Desulfovibrio sp.]
MHILIADDQPTARFILAGLLRKWGHRVVETADGAEALEHIERDNHDIDMLITDWSMPKMDGVQLARRVRALSSVSQYIYIILLTGKGELNDRIRGFTVGEVDDYVVKPFEAMELRMRIQVGGRVIRAERTQRMYNRSLEDVVRRQTEEIRETQQEIISRLFSALESRDQETGEHVLRIGELSAGLGRRLGWGADRLSAVQSAAPLHDIGKIGVPDTILRKAGPLTAEEFEAVKLHTGIGAHILSGSHNRNIRLAETIALRHHENWDGSGYPDGLSGTEIPVEARVVALVDVYDALLSDRVYRPGLPMDEVLRIIRSERGRKFDPDLCDIFLDMVEELPGTDIKT